MNVWLLFTACAVAEVHVSLKAHWKGPSKSSLTQQASECLWDIDRALYWSALERGGPPLEVLSPKLAALCTVSLHNREYSVRMEFFASLQRSETKDCESSLSKAGKLSCSPSGPYSVDHVYRQGKFLLVAYLDQTHPDFLSTHRSLIETASHRNATYILRPLDTRDTTDDFLGGYAAELLLKNMEYKPVEDTSINMTTQEGNWNIESKSYADLPAKLTHLLSAKESLSEFAEIVSSLPMHLRQISLQNPSGALIKELYSNNYEFPDLAGKNLLLINAHPVSINFFSVLRTLRVEKKAAEELVAAGIQNELVADLLELANRHSHMYTGVEGLLKTGKQTGRIYLNNLEEDAKYSDWSKNLSDFVYNFSPQFAEVALNLFNLIFVINIDTPQGWELLLDSHGLYEDNWPIRIGYILLGDPQKVVVLSQALKQLKGTKEANRENFFAQLKTSETLPDLVQAFSAVCPECQLDYEASYLYERPNQFCLDSGVCGPASFILNGRVLEVEDWRADLLKGIKKERQVVQYLAFSGYAKKISTAFFEEPVYAKTVDRINKELTLPRSNEVKTMQPPQWGFIISTHKPSLVTFTVVASQNDLDFVKMTLEALFRLSNLGIRFRYLLEFQEITQEWEPIVCKLYQLLYRRLQISEIPKDVQCSTEQLRTLLTSTKIEPVLLVNSRVVSPLSILSPLDFQIAYQTEVQRLGLTHISDKLSQYYPMTQLPQLLETLAYVVLKHTAHFPQYNLYSQYPIPDKLRQSGLTKEYPVTSASDYNVHALLNPMSEEAQALAQILDWVSTLGGDTTVTFTTDVTLKDKLLPVHRHFKLLIKKSFDDHLRIGHRSDQTYTLGLITEPIWVARLQEGKYDADNLIPNEEISVVYSLRSLLVVGHCAQYYNAYELEPPNGLQLKLSNSEYRTDTIVMKNLGYFQFKIMPGAFSVSLVPGRSQDLFAIQTGETVELSDIQGSSHLIHVEKLGNEELLDTSQVSPQGDTIHIFSLASGKLYERLIRIMMVSAVSTTKSKVKFWLLEDFFSPGFSEQIDRLSKALGFDYEFVSYVWPTWLYPQREKQRVIWAYKILFLDVLFPLSLQRVIYIDADQVVRADLKELWNMDLQGAPYAYTPFCDSNKDTAGFRFWSQGYWKNLLGDKPYHISALYVVDLGKFRSMAAGDHLRYYYETMAPNPNSLANLDQDLPNFAQFQVPIFSLPQEWLWCATWCSEETKGKAKTIDLCNNPLTKEPKIEAAKRIISEWTFIDESIQRFLNDNSNKIETYKYKEDL